MLRIALRSFSLAAILGITAVSLSACDLPGAVTWIFNLLNQQAPQTTQYAGYYGTMAINSYPGIPETLLYPIDDAVGFAQTMTSQAGWVANGNFTEGNVLAQSFAGFGNSVDMLYFSGHGVPGDVMLTNFSRGGSFSINTEEWGPGSTSGLRPANPVGFPITGRMKWLVLSSSDSVAGPPGADPTHPDWTANWTGLFAAPGSLHGMYGFWQGPGSCNIQNFPDRQCDIQDKKTYGNTFAKLAGQTCTSSSACRSSTTVHWAWRNAAQMNGKDTNWSIWEDSFAHDDIASGEPPSGSSYLYPPPYTQYLSHSLVFYSTSNPNGYTVNSVTVQPTTFILNPQSVSNESISDASLTSQFGSQSTVPVTVNDSGVEYSALTDGGGLRHMYGLSGLLFYWSEGQDNPVAFDQTTAQQQATSFVNDTLGMPGDAVLRSTLQTFAVNPDTGSAFNDGYEFIWTHADTSIGGSDAIKVTVEDRIQNNFVCNDWEWVDPGDGERPRWECFDWENDVTNYPYIATGYRLWRTLAGSDNRFQPPGQTSIDAQTAASALPSGMNITAYQPGLWMPDAAAPSDSGARSAWLFTIGGQEVIGVDAYTGQILGETFSQ